MTWNEYRLKITSPLLQTFCVCECQPLASWSTTFRWERMLCSGNSIVHNVNLHEHIHVPPECWMLEVRGQRDANGFTALMTSKQSYSWQLSMNMTRWPFLENYWGNKAHLAKPAGLIWRWESKSDVWEPCPVRADQHVPLVQRVICHPIPQQNRSLQWQDNKITFGWLLLNIQW